MIARGSRIERRELVRVKATAREVKGQARLCQGTKWIHRHLTAWSETEQRAGKARSGAGITAPIVAVLVTQAAIAGEAFPEEVVVLGEAVADAEEFRGNSGGRGDCKRRRRRGEGEKSA